ERLRGSRTLARIEDPWRSGTPARELEITRAFGRRQLRRRIAQVPTRRRMAARGAVQREPATLSLQQVVVAAQRAQELAQTTQGRGEEYEEMGRVRSGPEQPR